MRVIAVLNSKSGSGKTTTAVHLAAGIAKRGIRTLLVDMDPRGQVAFSLGMNAHELPHTMSTVIDRRCRLAEAIVPLTDTFHVAPAVDDLSLAEYELRGKYHREDRLRDALATVAASYAYAVVDCAAHLGDLSINALAAADEVLIPTTPDSYALQAIEPFLATLASITAELNPTCAILGILPTRVTRTGNAWTVVEAAHEGFGGGVRIFDRTIPESVKFWEAASLGVTVYAHAPDSPGAAAYHELAQDVVRGYAGLIPLPHR